MKNLSPESDLRALSRALKAFNHERDWEQFHSPKNLAICLSIEASEVLERFLWLGDEEAISADNKARIGEEAADVLISLLNLCERAEIDLPNAFADKLAKNAEKYPVERAKGSRAKYSDL